LQLLILGTPHSKSVTIHKDNLQPQIDKRRNRTFARRTRQKKTKVRKWRDKRALLCLRRWQPCWLHRDCKTKSTRKWHATQQDDGMRNLGFRVFGVGERCGWKVGGKGSGSK
jgi:hypothetical protein